MKGNGSPRWLCGMMAAVLAVSISGCGGGSVEQLGKGSGYLSGLEPADSLPEEFAEGYAAFSVDLLRELYAAAGENGGNIFFSPASIAIAAGMLAEGAEGDTRDQLLALFGAADAQTLTEGCRELQSLLSGNPKKYFRSANSLWVELSMKERVLPDYVQRIDAGYGALVAAEPFDQALPGKVNGWVKEITKGMITEALQPPMEQGLELLLCNALLFEGEWKQRFEKSATTEGIFHSPGGDIAIPLIHRTDKEEGRYYEDDEVAAALLDYKDGRTAMLVALPKGEMSRLVDGLTPEGIRRWIDGMESCALTLSMPRFSLRYRTEKLGEALSALGAEAAFTPSADFSRMVEGGGVFVSASIHETALEVDENGTRASAFTGFGLRKNAAPIPRELVLDRPFLCMILDKPTGALLFSGTVNRPDKLA